MSQPQSLSDEELTAAIAAHKERLEQIEERFFYIGEDPKVASEIADVQRQIDSLRRSLDELHQSPADRVADEIRASSDELERLEERFFYIAEDPNLASEIAGVQAHIQELKAQQQNAIDRDG